MDADEREIYYFLKSWGKEFVSAREIARRAGGKRRYRESHDWAKPVLNRMLERGIIESDNGGHYRLKPLPKREDRRRWASPQVARLLKESGKDFSESIRVEEDVDSYYEKL